MRQAKTNLITSIINITHPCERMEHYLHIIFVLNNRCQAEETVVSHVNIPVMCRNLEVLDTEKIAGNDTPAQTSTQTHAPTQKILPTQEISPILLHARMHTWMEYRTKIASQQYFI